MDAFDCISSEIAQKRIQGEVIPDPEDPSDSLPSKCGKILEWWHGITDREALDCFIQPCTYSMRSRQKDLFDGW